MILQSLSGYIVQSAICSNKCFVMVCRNVIAFPSQRADIEPSTEDRHGQNNKLFNHFNKKMQLRRTFCAIIGKNLLSESIATFSYRCVHICTSWVSSSTSSTILLPEHIGTSGICRSSFESLRAMDKNSSRVNPKSVRHDNKKLPKPAGHQRSLCTSSN